MNKSAFMIQFYLKRVVRRFRARRSSRTAENGGGSTEKEKPGKNTLLQMFTPPPEPHPDKIPISVMNCSFSYAGENVFEDVNFEIEQGTLVAITGKRSTGKHTLLEILGQVQVPPKGLCFVPSHLRVLHLVERFDIEPSSDFSAK